MRSRVTTWMPGVMVAALFGLPSPPNSRDRPFDADWRFLRGDAAGAESPAFDASRWRILGVPHDWSIEDISLLLQARCRY